MYGDKTRAMSFTRQCRHISQVRWRTKLSCDVKFGQEFWCQKLLKSDNYSSTYSQQHEWVFFSETRCTTAEFVDTTSHRPDSLSCTAWHHSSQYLSDLCIPVVQMSTSPHCQSSTAAYPRFQADNRRMSLACPVPSTWNSLYETHSKALPYALTSFQKQLKTIPLTDLTH